MVQADLGWCSVLLFHFTHQNCFLLEKISFWPEKSDPSQPMQSNTVSSVRPILAAKFSGANFVNLDGCLKYQIFLDISYIYIIYVPQHEGKDIEWHNVCLMYHQLVCISTPIHFPFPCILGFLYIWRL